MRGITYISAKSPTQSRTRRKVVKTGKDEKNIVHKLNK